MSHIPPYDFQMSLDGKSSGMNTGLLLINLEKHDHMAGLHLVSGCASLNEQSSNRLLFFKLMRFHGKLVHNNSIKVKSKITLFCQPLLTFCSSTML